MEFPAYHIAPHLLGAEDGTAVAAEWGHLLVPENRTKVNSNLIEIPFIRFKSRVENPGTPVFFLNGGPGDETLAIVQRFLPFVPGLLADLILVEQRGVGHSRPRLDCPGTYSLPLDHPLDFETLLGAARAHTERCVDFWTSQGVDLSGYNVREMAADINQLLQALGYDRINLLGGSFGSHHGFAVLRYFGEHIDRAVLSAVEGPNHTIKLPSTIQRHLEQLDRMVKADPDLSQDIPDFLGLMETVLDRLEKQPRVVEIGHPKTGEKVEVAVGKFDLQLATAGGLGSTAFLLALPARYHAMFKGDYSWLAEWALDARTGRETNIMSDLVDCASGASPERLAQIEREADETLLGNAINVPEINLRDALGNPDLGATFRSNLQTEVPVLLVSGNLDARTPVSNAEEVLTGLVNGQHLILDGVSHDFDLGDNLLLQYIETTIRFLMGESVAGTQIAAPFKFEPITQ